MIKSFGGFGVLKLDMNRRQQTFGPPSATQLEEYGEHKKAVLRWRLWGTNEGGNVALNEAC